MRHCISVWYPYFFIRTCLNTCYLSLLYCFENKSIVCFHCALVNSWDAGYIGAKHNVSVTELIHNISRVNDKMKEPIISISSKIYKVQDPENSTESSQLEIKRDQPGRLTHAANSQASDFLWRVGFAFYLTADLKLCSRTVWRLFYWNAWVYKLPHTDCQDQVTQQHMGPCFLVNEPQDGGRSIEKMTIAKRTPKARCGFWQKRDAKL